MTQKLSNCFELLKRKPWFVFRFNNSKQISNLIILVSFYWQYNFSYNCGSYELFVRYLNFSLFLEKFSFCFHFWLNFQLFSAFLNKLFNFCDLIFCNHKCMWREIYLSSPQMMLELQIIKNFKKIKVQLDKNCVTLQKCQ
jgi:hypothetical protein